MDAMKITYAVVGIIVGVIVLFYVIGGLASTLTTASAQISASGLPLSGLFASGGILFVLLMIGIFVAILIMVMRLMKHK